MTTPTPAPAPSSGSARAVRYAYLVASVAGVLFFVMSVALLGMWPKQVLDAQVRTMAPARPLALTASERRGRTIYGREGCAYCHTQQVRYLHQDMHRFGAPTLAWETHADAPHLWGTRRIGPDLARESGVRSADWHFAHLFAPRTLVPDSVMPPYKHLFAGAADRPTGDGRDLVAYLETLGRERELAGPEGEAHAREACDCEGDAMMRMAFEAERINAHPARPRRDGDVPALPPLPAHDSDGFTRGRQLFAAECAGCHGLDGKGGPGADALLPRPTDLTEHRYSARGLARVLWNGRWGTAMPAWREHPAADLAGVAAVVRSLAPQAEEPPVPSHILALGLRVYAAHCVNCHGVSGDGRGTASAELATLPADLTAQQPSMNAALNALRSGIPGTQMAPWTDRLTAAEIIAVAAHVRTLYTGDATVTGTR